jgi:cytochrome c oxidase subunit III
MATSVHEPPRIESRESRLLENAEHNQSRQIVGSGNGGGHVLPPFGNELRRVKEYAPPPSSTGMWVVLASISMTFAAFTSALIVRQGDGKDWHHLALPGILYFNTILLLASSVTLEIARRRIARFMRGPRTESAPAMWLNITLLVGLLFVVGQYAAWLQLRSRGLFLATNPNSSFFYVLTAVHALHVSGGMGGLVRVVYKLKNSTLRKSTLDATSHYWHFMDGLWVYLLLLLWMKL